MSVAVTLLGRLGNSLFQYAMGRIIAEHHSLALDCTWPVESKLVMGQVAANDQRRQLNHLSEYFLNAPLHLGGQKVDEPIERFELDGAGWQGHSIDLQAILANTTRRQIRLTGFFHRYEYLQPYRAQIQEWFRPKMIPIPFTIGDKDIVVNIRRGLDFDALNWTLSAMYYERVLSNIRELGQVYVCGTCIDDEVRRCLQKYQPIFYDGTPFEHFVFMKHFRRIVLSNSTFAWWAAFLSDATEVYAPRSLDGKAYAFTGYKDVDLHMREPRYIEIPAEFAKSRPPRGADPVMQLLGRIQQLVTAEGICTSVCDDLDDESLTLLRSMVAENTPVSLGEIRRRLCDKQRVS